MDRAQILAAYDAEVRARPIARAGFEVETKGSVTCLTGPFVFVSAWNLTPPVLDMAVARLVAQSRAARKPLIWRVFEHDEP